MRAFAKIIGEKLNKSRGPTYVLIPKQGLVRSRQSGNGTFRSGNGSDFCGGTEERFIRPDIPVEEMDAHISEPAFAQRAVDILDHMIQAQEEQESETPG